VAVFLVALGADWCLEVALGNIGPLSSSGRLAVLGVVQEAVFVIAVLWWLRSFAKAPVRSLGFPRLPLRDLVTGVGMGIVAILASFLVSTITTAIVHAVIGHRPTKPFSYLGHLHGPWTVVIALGAAVAAPIGEETLFRGFIYQGFANGMSRSRAALLSAGLFAFVHTYPIEWPAIFVSGLLLVIVYERRGRSLLASIVMHCTVNTTLVILTLTAPAWVFKLGM
jgi:uncharacterized protein